MLDNMSNLKLMADLARSELADAPLEREQETRCAACGRTLCDHPDPIYGGIVPPFSDPTQGRCASQLTK